MNKPMTGAFIVSYDISSTNDNAIVIIGKQEGKKMDIVNAFQGEEAMKLLNMLTEKKENK